MAQVTAVVWVQSLAWELPNAAGVAKREKKVTLGENGLLPSGIPILRL